MVSAGVACRPCTLVMPSTLQAAWPMLCSATQCVGPAAGHFAACFIPPPVLAPSSQVGRAGRDGSEAQCVALLDDSDFVRLRSLAFSSVLDQAAVGAFLDAIFSPAAEGHRPPRKNAKASAAPLAAAASSRGGARGKKRKAAADVSQGSTEDATAASGAGMGVTEQQPVSCGAVLELGQEDAGTEVAGGAVARRRFGVLAVRKLAAELDMREESMESVLSFLEADACPCLRMLPAAALSVKVSFYSAAPADLVDQYPVVQVCLWVEWCAHESRVWRRHCLLPGLPTSTLLASPCLRLYWRPAPTPATACTMCQLPS